MQAGKSNLLLQAFIQMYCTFHFKHISTFGTFIDTDCSGKSHLNICIFLSVAVAESFILPFVSLDLTALLKIF